MPDKYGHNHVFEPAPLVHGTFDPICFIFLETDMSPLKLVDALERRLAPR